MRQEPESSTARSYTSSLNFSLLWMRCHDPPRLFGTTSRMHSFLSLGQYCLFHSNQTVGIDSFIFTIFYTDPNIALLPSDTVAIVAMSTPTVRPNGTGVSNDLILDLRNWTTPCSMWPNKLPSHRAQGFSYTFVRHKQASSTYHGIQRAGELVDEPCVPQSR